MTHIIEVPGTETTTGNLADVMRSAEANHGVRFNGYVVSAMEWAAKTASRNGTNITSLHLIPQLCHYSSIAELHLGGIFGRADFPIETIEDSILAIATGNQESPTASNGLISVIDETARLGAENRQYDPFVSTLRLMQAIAHGEELAAALQENPEALAKLKTEIRLYDSYLKGVRMMENLISRWEPLEKREALAMRLDSAFEEHVDPEVTAEDGVNV